MKAPEEAATGRGPGKRARCAGQKTCGIFIPQVSLRVMSEGQKQREKRLSPKQEAFRDHICNWLVQYPWTTHWCPTFDRMEQRSVKTFGSKNVWVNGEQKSNQSGFARPDKQMGVSENSARKLFTNFMKKHLSDTSYFFVTEQNPHRDGHHVHALLAPATGEKLNWKVLGNLWWKFYGWSKFELIRDREALSGYCTKHVVRYLTKGVGWYDIQINDTDMYHGAIQRQKSASKLALADRH